MTSYNLLIHPNCRGDWGLNYDDGPFNRYTDSNAAVENKYAEPALYNFLAENNLHSTLFVSLSLLLLPSTYPNIDIVHWLQRRNLPCCSSTRFK